MCLAPRDPWDTCLALRDRGDTCPSPCSQGHSDRAMEGPRHANPTSKTSAWLTEVRAGLRQAGGSAPHCKRGFLAKTGAQSWQQGWGAAPGGEGETCPPRCGAGPPRSGEFTPPPRANRGSSPRLSTPKRAALAEMGEDAGVSALQAAKCGACEACWERAEVPAVPSPRPCQVTEPERCFPC